eukprot:gnl/MRDRNA2_/MRDRNA2_92373_c0_seq1.p1 gnl/MRDRNA2_/MRDRNA2_92373_c0~~gnl/MRDRNA2_/MRDRNA2_92373_c0_seq1.p1  ORF type:complete len:196 (-),score=45.44 gnl/MRDRNA2_/MRDRNA2_92373_c0_seq1:98-685(-)
MGDNGSVRSARSKSSSKNGSQRSRMSGSQGGSLSSMLPTSKTNRFDEVTKKPVPNLFNAEVMRALGSRGGALWERLTKDKNEAAGGGGQVGWSEAVSNTAAGSEDINYYNRKFGLEGCKVKITKTLLNKITEAIEAQDDGVGNEIRLITETEFLKSVVSAGITGLSKEQYSTMFKSIDKDGSGQIDFDEWMRAVG